ncbi:MAG: GntR family transcriptional regulator [Syntrophales bacterium]
MKPLMSQLAVRIVEHVRSQDMPTGAHLAEQALADAFHVSRGPVREALTILEREGIVLFHPNRGFFLTRPAREIPAPDLSAPVSTEEEMYYRFAGDRIRGELHGHISEAELMSRYGISRVKLMKILIRMSQEGWVERRPGHGWNFLPVLDTVEALDKSYRFRILVEPAALLEPTYRVDPVVFARLRGEQESLLASPIDERMPFTMFETGVRFHEQIVSCSGNPFFLDAVRHINRLRRLIEYRVPVDQARLNRYREHLEIIALLEQGRQSAASVLLRDHLDRSRMKKTAGETENERS